VSQKELHDAFAQGWVIESVEPSRYEVRPDLKDLSFSEGVVCGDPAGVMKLAGHSPCRNWIIRQFLSDCPRRPARRSADRVPRSRGQPDQETAMGFYSQVIVPLLCDFGLDRPFVAKYRRELLAHASGNILEIGFGTGLNLPYYPPHVRKVTTVDPNIGMYRRARRRIKQAQVEVD
jgi:hypothetical protein